MDAARAFPCIRKGCRTGPGMDIGNSDNQVQFIRITK
jgi:hypothetical protein